MVLSCIVCEIYRQIERDIFISYLYLAPRRGGGDPVRISRRCLILVKSKQEAQLSQRNRAMLRVIEYFAKSLKVIRNDNVE